jgi:hypothetical protein
LIVRTHWHVLSNTHGRRRVETQSVSSKPVRTANRAPGCGAADRRSLRIFRRVGRHQLATAGRPTMGSSLNGVIPRWTPERRPYDYRRSCVQGADAGNGRRVSGKAIAIHRYEPPTTRGKGGASASSIPYGAPNFYNPEQKLRAADPDRSGLIAPWHRTSSSFSPMELSARASPQRPSSITEVLNGRVQAADDAAALPCDLRIVATDLA